MTGILKRTYVVAVLAIVSAVACSSQLGDLKTLHNGGDYEAVAGTVIDCAESTDECGQMHLLKGDACYRLAQKAKADGRTADVIRFSGCAIDHMGAAFARVTDWEPTGGQEQWWVNYCESLRLLQNAQSGDAIKQTSAKLLEAAESFGAQAPDHPGPVYYASVAKLAVIRFELLHPSDPAASCAELNQLIEDLTSSRQRAQGTPFDASYQNLLSDLADAKSLLPDCS